MFTKLSLEYMTEVKGNVQLIMKIVLPINEYVSFLLMLISIVTQSLIFRMLNRNSAQILGYWLEGCKFKALNLRGELWYAVIFSIRQYNTYTFI